MLGALGSIKWADRRSGKLDQDERFELCGQALGLLSDTTKSLLARVLQIRRPKVTPEEVLSMRLPTTTAGDMAEKLAREVCSTALYQHCLRTYLWARILAVQEGIIFDDELLYVACLLHDLGLTHSQRKGRSGTACFAVLGARAAQVVCANIWTETRCEKLAHIISMHLNVRVRLADGPENHLLHEAANLDCTGIRFWEISRPTRHQVLSLQPRDAFVEEMQKVFRHEKRKFPNGRTAFLHRYLMFGLLLKLCPLRDVRK
jgi:hypothetical protein